MTAQISAYGRLVADPQTRTTTTVTTWQWRGWRWRCPAMRQRRRVTFWLGVIAFGKQADALAKHVKGDLSVWPAICRSTSGRAGWRYTAGYQVVADSVISARTVRPGGKAGQQGQATDALRRAQQPSRDEYDQRPPFDDETPF
jgi:single-stranded DNA-binding protein